MDSSDLNSIAMSAMHKAGRVAGCLDINHPDFEAHLKCSHRFLWLALNKCDQCEMSREKLWRIRDFGAQEKAEELRHANTR